MQDTSGSPRLEQYLEALNSRYRVLRDWQHVFYLSPSSPQYIATQQSDIFLHVVEPTDITSALNTSFQNNMHPYVANRFANDERDPTETIAEYAEPEHASMRDNPWLEKLNQPNDEEHSSLLSEVDVYSAEQLVAGRFVILGAPGSGKSHAIASLVQHCLHPASNHTGIIPIPLIMRDFGRAWREHEWLAEDAVLCFLQQILWPAWGISADHASSLADDLCQYLQTNKAILLLDGLDAQPTIAERRRCNLAIQALLRRFQHLSCVATSRQVGYDTAALACGVRPVIIQALTDAQITEYVGFWRVQIEHHEVIQADAGLKARAERSAHNLLQEINKCKSAQVLAGNPMYLQMLCLIAHAGAVIPETRVGLFRRCVEVGISLWQRNSIRLILPDANCISYLLEYCALYLLENPSYEAHKRSNVAKNMREYAQQHLVSHLHGYDNNEVIEYLLELWLDKNGLLSYSPVGQLIFFQQPLQEYLVARAITKDTTTLKHYVQKYAFVPTWRDIISFAAADMGDHDAISGAKFIMCLQSQTHPHKQYYALRLAMNAVWNGTDADRSCTDALLEQWCLAYLQNSALRPALLRCVVGGQARYSMSALRHLHDAQEHGDLATRLAAQKALETLGSYRTVNMLRKVLRGEGTHGSARTLESIRQLPPSDMFDDVQNDLRDKDEDVRSAAAAALGRMGSSEAVHELHKALQDEAWDVRSAAAEALGSIRTDAAMRALSAAVEDTAWPVRSSAAESLGHMSSLQALPALKKALHDVAWLVRSTAAHALGKLSSPQVEHALRAVLHDEAWPVRRAAAESLGDINAVHAVSDLGALLKDNSAEVRFTAAIALGRIRSGRGIDDLVNAIHDPSEDIRRAIAGSLGYIASARAIPDLSKMMLDKSWPVRRAATLALGNIASNRCLNILLSALQDQSWPVRRDAAWSLGQIKAIESVSNLCKSLRDEAWPVRCAVAEALGNIGDESATEALSSGLYDSSGRVRKAMAHALGKIDTDNTRKALRHAMLDTQWKVRRTVAEALTALGSMQASKYLGTMLVSDSNPYVRRAAVYGLEKLSSETCLTPLSQAIHDTDASVRRNAVLALGTLASPSSLAQLLLATEDEDHNVRHAAVIAIANSGSPQASNTLIRLLEQCTETNSDNDTEANNALILAIIYALGCTADVQISETVCEILLPLLQHNNINIAQTAAEALERIDMGGLL
ncbi:MAG: HEAT repeat domain-containing protein [Mariprofundales bacterium]